MEQCEVSMWACSAPPASSVSSSSRASPAIPGFVPPGSPPANAPKAKPYGAVAPWRLAAPIPDCAVGRTVEACTPGRGPHVVFSALDASVAGDIEQAFAAAGHFVVSNARNFRMDPLVPLLIPEVNADHLTVLPEQQRAKGWKGAIVTNPNCSTVVLAMALAPLRAFDLQTVIVSTMQAVSGAGYPGRAVARHPRQRRAVHRRRGREDRSETLKILGRNGGRTPHPAVISAHTNRVAGARRPHHDDLRRPRGEAAMPDDRRGARSVSRPAAGARSAERADPPIVVATENNRPQPRLDADRGDGMAVTVGRVRPCKVTHTKFVALGHNTVRGAAGAAILNAELMAADGIFD